MPLEPVAQAALIKWLNTFPLDHEVESVADLKDGFVFSKVLADIDLSYSHRTIPRPDTLREFVIALIRYIRTQCDGLDPLLESQTLKTVAEHKRTSQMFEILVVVLMAAISGPDREKYVMTITKLDPAVQTEIANIIQKKQKEIEQASASSSTGPQDPGISSTEDFELEFEVRYSTLIAQKKNLEQERERLKKQLADLTTRLERLQDNNDLLQGRLTAAEDGLTNASREQDAAKVIKGLEAKIREQDELIANQEGQVEQDRVEKGRMRKEIDRLTATSDLVIELKDENKELQYQNLELTKKANTAERYKQKLESQRDFQADIKKLELDNEELKLQSRDFELLKYRNESLEATHVQFQNTLGRREMEIFELSSQKKTLDEEKADLQRAVLRLEELKSTDEAHISDLRDQINGKPQSSGFPVVASMGSLEEELEGAQTETRTNLEVSRLRAENQLLKGNAPAAQEAAATRIRLDELERIKRREEEKYNQLFEKHVLTSQQLTAVLNASTAEGLVKSVNAALLLGRLEVLTPEYYSSEAFSNLRKSYLEAIDKISDIEKKNQELEAVLEEAKRELLIANTDLSMIEKQETEALEEFKSSQEALSFSIGEQLKTLQSRYKDLQVDHEQQKSQLIHTLLSKEKLQQAVDEMAQNQQMAAEALKTKQTKETEDRANADLKTSQEKLEKQDRIIHELQARMKELENGGIDSQTVALEKQNAMLQREYDMMTTAWYDLASRLQSNTVVLQRRADAPRSWIKGQRQAINPFGKRLP